MADLIEFWQQKGKIFVEFNSKTYSFLDFVKLPEGKFVIDAMFNKIVIKYPNEILNKKNKYDAVGNFIKNHFLKKDKIFDVIIYNNGKLVKFNLEE